MPKIKNVSPFGDLDVPLLGLTVASGSIVEVSDEQAGILLQQEANWQAWGEPAKKAKRREERAEAKVPTAPETTVPPAIAGEGDDR